MPCIRVAEDVWTGELSTELIPPAEVQQEARNDLKSPDFPRYRSDPTYWWAKQAEFNKIDTKTAQWPEEARECFEEECTTASVCLIAGCKKLGSGSCTG